MLSGLYPFTSDRIPLQASGAALPQPRYAGDPPGGETRRDAAGRIGSRRNGQRQR